MNSSSCLAGTYRSSIESIISRLKVVYYVLKYLTAIKTAIIYFFCSNYKNFFETIYCNITVFIPRIVIPLCYFYYLPIRINVPAAGIHYNTIIYIVKM